MRHRRRPVLHQFSARDSLRTDIDDGLAREWLASLDYGYTHCTAFYLGFTDGDGNVYLVDEHAQRPWLPERHAAAIHQTIARHVKTEVRGFRGYTRPLELRDLDRIVAGADVFSRQSDGRTVAQQYSDLGIRLKSANTDRERLGGILNRLGDPEDGIAPTLFIHERCRLLIESLPALQHDPNHPEDVLKVDTDEEGVGGDDPADALRYLLATKPSRLVVRKLAGF